MIVLIFAITLLIYMLNSCNNREGIVNEGSYTSSSPHGAPVVNIAFVFVFMIIIVAIIILLLIPRGIQIFLVLRVTGLISNGYSP